MGEPATSRTLVAVLGGVSQRGTWRLAPRLRVLAFLGGAELDLREATIPEENPRITVLAVLGGVTLIVPRDMAVELSGGSLLGGRSDERVPEPPSSPTVLHVRAFTLLGGVSIEDHAGGDVPRRRVDLDDDAVTVRLSGLGAFGALTREVRVPYASIRGISTSAPSPSVWAGRVGLSVPFSGIRYGRFRREGGWDFLAVEHPERAIALDVDGVSVTGRPVRRVVVDVSDAHELATELERRTAGR